MKQIVLILMSLLTFSNPSKAQKQTVEPAVSSRTMWPNTLVAGNPAKLIRRI
ncbi:hypothetical protein NXY07_02865 [Phocaeicola dorei]|nr:hypothetical protein [Phocaeicola dorei]